MPHLKSMNFKFHCASNHTHFSFNMELMAKTVTVTYQAFIAVDSALTTLNCVIDFRAMYLYPSKMSHFGEVSIDSTVG